MSELDHVRQYEHPVEQSEARIADIQNRGGLRESDRVMHAAGRRRFELIAADRTVNEQADVFGLQSRSVEPPCER